MRGVIILDNEDAREIVRNAVETTKPTWSNWDVHWEDIDEIFLIRSYEQMGFDNWIFIDLLNKHELNIEKIGNILEKIDFERKYNREFAGSLESPLYKNMVNGTYGSEGKNFYQSVKEFKGGKGAMYYKLLWYMLVTCNHLQKKYHSSFSHYLKSQYSDYKDLKNISDDEFLKISPNEWEDFKQHKKPWNELYGIGINVFDFIMGDIVELEFVKDSYKLDSANKRFLEKTGICKRTELNHENVIKILRNLNLPYSLREINKGLYAYCSKLQCGKYCFCRYPEKCQECDVEKICEKNF